MAKILFIAPLPPPISGHSLASKVFFDYLLINEKEVILVDLNKKAKGYNFRSIKRIIEVLSIFYKVAIGSRNSDYIYFTISESWSGNFKDLVIYLLCSKRLSKMYIHLHGGSIGQLLFDKSRLIRAINKFFISKMAGVIILGESHKSIFEGMIKKDKIYVVPNFAEDSLFLRQEKIKEKFSTLIPLKIVFVSNLLKKKGYDELVGAFFRLEDKMKGMVTIDFAGRFDSEAEKTHFLKNIDLHKNLTYHGVINGESKRKLYENAHLLCLPTSYLEGQPIAILEAYASGCVVLTTISGGIGDIFKDNINGFSIEKRSADAVLKTIKMAVESKNELLNIAIYNNFISTKNYRVANYNKTMESILDVK